MYTHTFERSLRMMEDIEDFWTRPPLHGAEILWEAHLTNEDGLVPGLRCGGQAQARSASF